MALTFEQISQLNDTKVKEIFVDEWNDSVFVKAMSTIERIKFEEKQKQATTDMDNIVNLLLFTMCDSGGKLIFAPEQDEILFNKSPSALVQIFKNSIELNLLSDKELEERAKN